MEQITQAAILSAGLGTRLRPLTNTIPKVMVPIGGKPLIQHHLEQLKRHGIKEVFINLHYLPEVVRRHCGNGSQFGVTINYAVESEILGTAGGLKNFERGLKKNFFVIYGDIFNVVNYSKMAETFRKKPGAIGMEIVGATDHPYDSDLVDVDEELRFLKIYSKPHTKLPDNYKSMKGIFIFDEKIFRHIPPRQPYQIDHDLLPHLLKQGEKIYGYESDEYMADIGTLERYKKTLDAYESIKRLNTF